MTPAWATNTKLNVAAMLKKWKGYCELMQLGDWVNALETAGKDIAMSFLIHLCETCDIESEGTSWEYFRQWKQLYSLANGKSMDTNDSNEVHAFHKTHVVPRFKLSPPAARIKTVTDSGDLLALLSFNVAYDRRILPSERRRLDLAACYLILAYTGCRPAEIVDGEKAIPSDGCWDELFGTPSSSTLPQRPKALCYEDMQLVVFAHHKGADNKPKPTIFYFTPTRRLVFCLVTLIASIAVLDGAFASPALNDSVDAVFGARVSGPVSHTPLRWKPEWLRRPVFHRDVNDVDLFAPLSYSTLHDCMTRQSLDMGYEKEIGPKDWRRNDAYLNQHVCFDVQNAVLGELLQERVLGVLTHVGRTRDPCASSDMVPDDVWQHLPADPAIVELEARRDTLKAESGYRVKGTPHEDEIRDLNKRIYAAQEDGRAALP
ncbi:hypothetical protein AX16_001468 [Volvariella volvacea WC 439]|nr:hypothetical protein AX16_001468 [Volvariella volvacea WC 439]